MKNFRMNILETTLYPSLKFLCSFFLLIEQRTRTVFLSDLQQIEFIRGWMDSNICQRKFYPAEVHLVS